MTVYERISPQQRAEREEMRNQCRVARHWMEIVAPPPDWSPSGLYRAARYVNHWRCAKCGTYRHDGINANGGLLIRRYDNYPEGYLLAKDEPRPTSDQLRLWIAKRYTAMGIKKPALRSAG